MAFTPFKAILTLDPDPSESQLLEILEEPQTLSMEFLIEQEF